MVTDISLRQTIAIVLTPVIVAFLIYLQQEKENNWFYTIAIVFFLVLLVMIMGIILYNILSHSQQAVEDLNE
jgi:ABC-type spermidine/putrescine transport system permease subunit I